MKRDWKLEIQRRCFWIRWVLEKAGAEGVVLGLSGGKDSAVVSALCANALGSDNVMGVIMPCNSLNKDEEHARLAAEKINIWVEKVDLSETFSQLAGNIKRSIYCELDEKAVANIKPRLRMTTLYAIAQTKNYLVAGTGNRSEIYMGYSTKWGDGACDFNPIADLTVSEVLELGRELGVPEEILTKAPSAGLWEGQTDEQEMGVTYKEIGDFLLHDIGTDEVRTKIISAHRKTEHKRNLPKEYNGKLD